MIRNRKKTRLIFVLCINHFTLVVAGSLNWRPWLHMLKSPQLSASNDDWNATRGGMACARMRFLFFAIGYTRSHTIASCIWFCILTCFWIPCEYWMWNGTVSPVAVLATLTVQSELTNLKQRVQEPIVSPYNDTSGFHRISVKPPPNLRCRGLGMACVLG